MDIKEEDGKEMEKKTEALWYVDMQNNRAKSMDRKENKKKEVQNELKLKREII